VFFFSLLQNLLDSLVVFPYIPYTFWGGTCPTDAEKNHDDAIMFVMDLHQRNSRCIRLQFRTRRRSTDEMGIPLEHLQMNSDPTDPNAMAVILFDHGLAEVDDEYNIRFTRHARIKILRPAGKDWGSVAIPFHEANSNQTIDDVEGATYTLNADGCTTKTELSKGSLFEQRTTDTWKRKKFTLPNLSAGCVIEYRYQIRSKGPHYIPDCDF
jgi:hypothetical protein